MMCGIAAVVQKPGGATFGAEATAVLERMLRALKHRGKRPPHYAVNNLGGLGCCRLSIVDRSAGGEQPITGNDGTLIVFNGEIYNYRQLKRHLIQGGHDFTSDCDTEVILAGYKEWGVNVVDHLDGMYAFVIADEIKGRVFAARDPVGIKPLYIAEDSKAVYFSSELKSLLVSGCMQPRNINPGHAWINGKLERYANMAVHPRREADEDKKEARKILREKIGASVRERIATDLPVAVLCSGGIDSSIVLYEASRVRQVTAFCIGTAPDDPDPQSSQALCQELGVDYRFVQVEEQALLDSIAKTVAVIESFEPNHIRGGSLSLRLAEAVSQAGFKVAICGEGADELFAGYPEFESCLSRSNVDASVREMVEMFVAQLYRTQLQRVDRTGMAYALEVRVPFLDTEVVSYALSLPGAWKISRDAGGILQTKKILRDSYRGLLPDAIVDRPKVVLSEGAGVGDNSARGPFYKYALENAGRHGVSVDDEAKKMFSIRNAEEEYYLGLFLQVFGALEEATVRPRVNSTAFRSV